MTNRGDHDLVVIGSGGAAMAAGIEARRQGASVLLVEQGPLGGTCLNVGCVPSKTLLAAAGQRHAAASRAFPAIATSAGPVDLPALMAQKQGLIDGLRQAKYAHVAEAHGFEVRSGHAEFDSPNVLLVDGEPRPATAYVVATGALPAQPDLAGISDVDYLTSSTAMELTSLPRSMVVLGGGYVGLEQAQLLSRLGVDVTLVGRLGPRSEPELADVLRRVFNDEGIHVVEERAVSIEQEADVVRVTTDSGAAITAERLLVATGRRPHTDGLALDSAGIDTDDRGCIVVDAAQRSSNPKVWAAGDVTPAPQFVYVAARTGHVAAANALGGHHAVDWTGLPAVTFTSPQLASAGRTETEAVAAGYDCVCRVLDARDIPRALASNDTRGVLKIVAEAGTGKVLGVHAALEGAGDVMLAATYAITRAMTTNDLADTWAPYLTMSEALRICAGLFRSDKPTSCCA